MHYRTLTSPIGPLLLAGDEHGVRFLLFANGRKDVRPRREWVADNGELDDPARQLSDYFRGRRREFDVAVAPQGTEFQRSVWAELQRIPFGHTISYAELATRIGNRRAVRAVGLANGSNPISIIIPCHRVIGSNGSLVGYGGGLPTKQALLALERGQARLL
jgi:methylated-DNA-[protein]-cysteine S-methyltransferase